MATSVANPLTLVMTIKSDQDYQSLKATIEHMQKPSGQPNPIAAALTQIGTVHFARFVFIGTDKLAVITTYDGDFAEYLDRFVEKIGGVFDALLAHVKDAPPLPVDSHREEFKKFVEKYDLKCIPPFYSAYPDLKVLDILTLQRQAAGS